MSACTEPDERVMQASLASDGSTPWFVEAATIGFVHATGAAGGLHLPEVMGAGVAMLDIDNDGDLDLYFTCGNTDPVAGAVGTAGPTNRLFRRDAPWVFVDVTAGSGLGDPGYGMGVAVGDIDNDGDVDVYAANLGPDRLYRNRGDGTFEDVTARAGIDVAGWSCSATFLDYDRDGLLDLYVTQYVEYDPRRRCWDHAGRPDYCGPQAYRPVPDVLLRNNGDGTFADVSGAAGIASVACAGLGVVAEDFDGDGWVDLYVANDAQPNQLWLNHRDGRFVDAAVELGCAYNLHGQAEAGMGVVAGDMDGDGLVDVFVTHLGAESNTLYRGLGDAGFEDATGPSGLGSPSLPFTGFGTVAADLDLDGDLDVVVVNGRVVRGEPWPPAPDPPWDRFAEPNLLYVNDGRGVFEPAGELAPALCAAAEISRGLAAGDLDDDGDVDLVVANVAGAPRLLANQAPRRGRWLAVRAVDPRLGRDALGARITVVAGGRRWSRTIHGGGSYLSSGDTRAHFGLGDATSIDAVTVRWPDGMLERFEVACADCAVVLHRGQGSELP